MTDKGEKEVFAKLMLENGESQDLYLQRTEKIYDWVFSTSKSPVGVFGFNIGDAIFQLVKNYEGRKIELIMK